MRGNAKRLLYRVAASFVKDGVRRACGNFSWHNRVFGGRTLRGVRASASDPSGGILRARRHVSSLALAARIFPSVKAPSGESPAILATHYDDSRRQCVSSSQSVGAIPRKGARGRHARFPGSRRHYHWLPPTPGNRLNPTTPSRCRAAHRHRSYRSPTFHGLRPTP